MRMQYFGDSYDVVKQSLLRWLRSLGDWSVHPMFTEAVSPAQVAAFECMLGAPLISREILTTKTDRDVYFSRTAKCGHLFLDPDIGLRMQSTRGARAPEYLFADELLRLCDRRPQSLTLVFDQGVARGKEKQGLQNKLLQLSQHRVSGFAYVSHACFVLVSHDNALVEQARRDILVGSRLPESRFLPISIAQQRLAANGENATAELVR